MCLYPRLILNRKYTSTKKNKGIIPVMNDERVKYVAIGCGKCMECTKKKARDWKVRLNEEIRNSTLALFVTLTFDEQSLSKFNEEFKDVPEELRENEIATKATRLFLERWRKSYKKSLRHWLITEKGHKNTERIHLHGILFTDKSNEIEKHWKYGWVYIGKYVNEKTINYIAKYVTKIDLDHKWFTGKILTSAGIGVNYTKRPDSQLNKYNETKTNELYKTKAGTKLPLPIYYRNKLYTEEEREKLWCKKLDEQTRYICGEKIDVSTIEGDLKFDKLLQFYRNKNARLGYGTINWDSAEYKKKLKILKKIATNEKKLRSIVKQKNNKTDTNDSINSIINNCLQDIRANHNPDSRNEKIGKFD